MRHHALVVLALAAVLGAAATAPLPLDQRLTIALAIAGFSAVIGRAGESRALRALVLLALVCSGANAWWQRCHETLLPEMRTARYGGIVLGDEQTGMLNSGGSPGAAGGNFSFVCGLDGGPHVLVSGFGQPPPIGSHAVVRGRLEPFDEARNPGEPSQREIERERGLAGHLAAAHILRVEPAPAIVFPLLSARNADLVIARMHAWALLQLRRYLPEPQASLVAGELWGERSALPPELHDEFQETGTVHVLVTAGLHLGVVAALVTGLLQLLKAPRVFACSFTIACAWGYALFSGAHEPAVRAATMLSFALSARACGRKALSWNALGAAGLLFAFFRPLEVTGASFLLSFSCVGAIFVAATPVARQLERWWHVPERLQEAIALAVATQLGTWPLTAAIFLQFSPYAMLANFLVVPVVGGTMSLAGAQLLCAWMPPVAQGIANLNDWCLTWILSVVHVIAMLPHARVIMTPAPMWCIAAYDLALLAMPWLWKRTMPSVCIAIAGLAIALVLWPP